jgi:hypothetical protein
MTLIVFIYVYYGLFVCINLVDVISISGKIHPEIVMVIFRKNHRFISEVDRLIAKTGQILVFWISTIPLSSLVHFGRISPIFSEFFKNLRNRSEFPPSAEFSNIASTSPAVRPFL